MPPFCLTTKQYFRSVCVYNIYMNVPILICYAVKCSVVNYFLSSKYSILLIGVCMLLFVISK